MRCAVQVALRSIVSMGVTLERDGPVPARSKDDVKQAKADVKKANSGDGPVLVRNRYRYKLPQLVQQVQWVSSRCLGNPQGLLVALMGLIVR